VRLCICIRSISIASISFMMLHLPYACGRRTKLSGIEEIVGFGICEVIISILQVFNHVIGEAVHAACLHAGLQDAFEIFT